MESSTHLERQKVEELMLAYQASGYEVIGSPSLEGLPESLTDYRPSLLARKGEETVVIEVKTRVSLVETPEVRVLSQAVQQRPGWRFELIVVHPEEEILGITGAAPMEPAEIGGALGEAVMLMEDGRMEAALLRTWAATEAALRLVASREGIQPKQIRGAAVAKELAVNAVISREEYQFLRDVMKTRNAVAHGFKSDQLNPQLVRRLVEATNRLLQQDPDEATLDEA